jgi:hypothetical protein
MTSREIVLGQIRVGDIFNAEDAAGPSRTCLTISITQKTILARSVTTQEIIEFDRRTGTASHLWHSVRYDYVINSATQLPTEIHQVMLSIDQKFHDLGEKPAGDGKLERAKLSKEQIRGLLFIAEFYKANPLPA